MSYLGIRPEDSAFLRRDHDSQPTLSNTWNLGSPELYFKSIYTNQVVIYGNGALTIPTGTSSQRPTEPSVGMLRYNTDTNMYEGYSSSSLWVNIGGVKDVDGDTYITSEDSAGNDNDQLKFYTAGSTTPRMIIDTDGTLLPGSTNMYNIGSSSSKYNNIYINGVDITGSMAHASGSDSTMIYGAWTLNTDATLVATSVPYGTTAQRSATPETGMIRYNIDTKTFEGYNDSSSWIGLGQLKDTDGDTFIIAESTAGADDDEIKIYVGDENDPKYIINSSGELLPNITNQYSIGNSSYILNNMYTDGLNVQNCLQHDPTTSTTTVYGDWNLDSNATLEATYADIAERYYSDCETTYGDVLVVGGDNEVTLSTIYNQTPIAGVVSTNPAFKLNSKMGEDETHPYIALKGRVPCKVIGDIKKGDVLVASDTKGVATSCLDVTNPLSIVGIALEDYNSNIVGLITIKV